MRVEERSAELGGLPVHWRTAGDAPILYLHGVPTGSWDWLPFLELAGGVAPDLPGFGRSGKPSGFRYSIEGYADFLQTFVDAVGLERFSLVVHDWGAVGLALAQRRPERVERLVSLSCVPFLPGYRWHRIARIWRTPLAGEVAMGFTFRWAFRRLLPAELADAAWERFDHGTQRAILKLYRSAPPEALARAGKDLHRVRCPALLLWSTRDPYIPVEFAERYAEALGGEATLEPVDAGHWPWLARPELIRRTAEFLSR